MIQLGTIGSEHRFTMRDESQGESFVCILKRGTAYY